MSRTRYIPERFPLLRTRQPQKLKGLGMLALSGLHTKGSGLGPRA